MQRQRKVDCKPSSRKIDSHVFTTTAERHQINSRETLSNVTASLLTHSDEHGGHHQPIHFFHGCFVTSYLCWSARANHRPGVDVLIGNEIQKDIIRQKRLVRVGSVNHGSQRPRDRKCICVKVVAVYRAGTSHGGTAYRGGKLNSRHHK